MAHWADTSALLKTSVIPAHTEAGRQTKASVLDWRDPDDQVDWRIITARQLFADLLGGEAGKN
jgi:hypothetical protein